MQWIVWGGRGEQLWRKRVGCVEAPTDRNSYDFVPVHVALLVHLCAREGVEVV